MLYKEAITTNELQKMKEFKYTIDGKEYNVAIEETGDNNAKVVVNGEEFAVQLPEKKNKKVAEKTAPAKVVESAPAEAAPAANVNTNNAVKAPLPGTITAINVEVGQEVKAGDTLLVLEAMKMANNIEAESDGKVAAVCVKVGQAVLEDDPLIVIE